MSGSVDALSRNLQKSGALNSKQNDQLGPFCATAWVILVE